MMRALIKGISTLTFLIALVGCSEDLPQINPTPAPSEEEPLKPTDNKATDAIAFSFNEPVSSRAYFESRFKFKWMHGDQILIYSPDVNQVEVNVYDANGEKTGTKACPNPNSYGYYYVNEWDGTIYDPDHNEITPVGETLAEQEANSLFWSNGNTAQYWGAIPYHKGAAGTGAGWHRFFAAYPSDRVIGVPSGIPSLTNPNDPAVFKMQYKTNQYNTIDKDAYDYSVDNQGGQLTYNGVPEMDNCYLMAMRELQYNSDHVLLDFDPIMTILDVKVSSGGYEIPIGVVKRTRITGISVIMTHGMTNGDIEYDLSEGTRYEAGYRQVMLGDPEEYEGQGKLKSGSYNNNVETVFVGVKWRDGSGTMQNYIDLGENESVNLTAFLPPIPKDETVGYKIKVHAVGAANYVVALNGTHLSEATLGGEPTTFTGLTQQSRVEIVLPTISVDDPMKLNKWMSYLNPKKKILDLSIPGFRFSGNHTHDELDAILVDILPKGVRFFDMTDVALVNDIHHVIERLLELKDQGLYNEPVFVRTNRISSGDPGVSGNIYGTNINGTKVKDRLYRGNFYGTLEDLSKKDMMIWGRSAIGSGNYYNKCEAYYAESALRLDNVVTEGYSSPEVKAFSDFTMNYTTDWESMSANFEAQTGCVSVAIIREAQYNALTEAEKRLYFQSIIDLNFKTH